LLYTALMWYCAAGSWYSFIVPYENITNWN
jgi:hypothetical protein